MTKTNKARARLQLLIAIIASGAPTASLAAKPAPAPTVPAQERPAVTHFASAAQALEQVLATPAQVVAFGEYHQTTATVMIPSSLLRFTDELLPLVAKQATDLVVETWVTDGGCGKQETKVVEKVQTTTERPPETENEIVTLFKRAKAAGIAPHILTMSCKDYRRVTDKDGETDFAKMLTLTRDRLQSEVSRWLVAPGPVSRERKVVVYGGALHNDLYPAPGDRPFAFGRSLFAKAKGQYLEVDLFVPEYILGDKRMAAEPWFAAFKAGIEAGDALLIRRSPRSYIIGFPVTIRGATARPSGKVRP
jgi:hypothetical protein